jgi:mxaJ protein
MSSRCRIDELRPRRREAVAVAVALWCALLAASAHGREFKVCAEPANLPFSSEKSGGFEIEIGRILADAIGAEFKPVWVAQRGHGFYRATLGSGRCDAFIGMPARAGFGITTQPYYRASWMFVRRADRDLDVTSFDDPRLKTAKVALPMVGEGFDTPPVIAFARRALVDNVRPFPVDTDLDDDEGQGAMVEAVAKGEVDLAVAWGPSAAWFARKQKVALALTPTPEADAPGVAFTTAIAVAVARDKVALRDELDRALVARHAEIERVLDRYAVPRLTETR